MVQMPGFGAAVEMLKGGISHHVEEEETQLLPELKESLERDEWLAIGDALVQAKEAAGLPVPHPHAASPASEPRARRARPPRERHDEIVSLRSVFVELRASCVSHR
jgi:hypothetical protein